MPRQEPLEDVEEEDCFQCLTEQQKLGAIYSRLGQMLEVLEAIQTAVEAP